MVKFTKNNVDKENDIYGVYKLGSSTDIIYIGKGIIRSSLISHFLDGQDPMMDVSLYRVEYTGSKERAEQRERAELGDYYKKNGRFPKFNRSDW